MKKLIVAFSAVLLTMTMTAAQAQTATTANSAQPAVQDVAKVLEISDVDHDMGKIPYGKPVEYELSIKNISNDSIKLQNVQAGCGCTTPKWQAGPYAPGETFKIKVGFNGSTKGAFTKNVTIFLENGLSKQIKFHGETFEAPDNAAPANAAVGQLKPATN